MIQKIIEFHLLLIFGDRLSRNSRSGGGDYDGRTASRKTLTTNSRKQ
jgi:hypothetical protein